MRRRVLLSLSVLALAPPRVASAWEEVSLFNRAPRPAPPAEAVRRRTAAAAQPSGAAPPRPARQRSGITSPRDTASGQATGRR
jgi:hypothetical protein